MHAAAKAKHHLALFLIAIGSLGMACALVGIAIAVDEAMRQNGMQGDKILASSICSTLSGGLGIWSFRRGLVIRTRAIQAGSTVHLHDGSGIWTTRSGTAKPSFIQNKGKAGETPTDEGERNGT